MDKKNIGKSAKITSGVELGAIGTESQESNSFKQLRLLDFANEDRRTFLRFLECGFKVPFFFLLILMICAMVNEKVLAEEKHQGTAIQKKQDEANKHYYSVVDELACGEKILLAVTIREKGSEYVDIVDQLIYFIEPKKDEKIIVRGTSDWDIRKQENLNLKQRKTIEYLAYSWDCIKDETAKEYAVISFSSGGNCPSCAWEEVYDLNGKAVASTYIPYFKSLKDGRFDAVVASKADDEIMGKFNNKLKSLGLKYEWQLLKKIKYEN